MTSNRVSSERLFDKTISTISFRSINISHEGSCFGIHSPIMRGSQHNKVQFLCPFPQIDPLARPVFRIVFGRLTLSEYLQGNVLMEWFNPSRVMKPLEIKSLRHKDSSTGMTTTKKSCKMSIYWMKISAMFAQCTLILYH